MSRPPLGQRVHLTLLSEGRDAAAALARDAGQPDLFDRVTAVAAEDPAPSFLHSALCAMSLPVRRPADDSQPIIRQDGQYTLVITPKAIIRPEDGQAKLHVLGVPYGVLPRLILIHIMTEAVRTKSRQIVLGSTFTDWMRRMGYKTMSYGPRGSATLVRQQLDRLLACEWMIRWDGEDAKGDKEFGIKEIKLTTEYAGTDGKSGSFTREIVPDRSLLRTPPQTCRATQRARHPPASGQPHRARSLYLVGIPATPHRPQTRHAELAAACGAFRQ